MTYRLLALDIDGTLVDVQNNISLPTRLALQRAQAHGVQIMLATGRRYSRAWPVAEALGLTLPVVTASGALIKHPPQHRTLFRACFNSVQLRAMLQFMATAGHEPVLYTDSFGQGYDFHLPQGPIQGPELREFLDLNGESIRHEPDLINDPPAEVFAGFVMGQHAAMLQLASELHARWPGELYLHVIRSPRYRGYMCEIAPVGVSKWSGVQFVARHCGIAEQEICAVGDDVNDLPMIAGAGLGIAMGNASSEVQAAANRVTGRQDEDGLVQVVEWLLG